MNMDTKDNIAAGILIGCLLLGVAVIVNFTNVVATDTSSGEKTISEEERCISLGGFPHYYANEGQWTCAPDDGTLRVKEFYK